MKKIAIYGSYNKTSIGDTAILLGILSSLQRIYGNELIVNILLKNHINILEEMEKLNITLKVNIYVITEYPKADFLFGQINLVYKKVLNKVFKKVFKKETILKSFQDVDHLLIGGGNLIMDLYRNSPDIMEYICELANKCKVSYSFVGVGAGPINTENGIIKFRKCLMGAKKIYLRDRNSLKILNKLYPHIKCNVMPDLALGMNVKVKEPINKDILLVNVASVYGKEWPITDYKKFNTYINNVYKVIKSIIKLYDLKKIEIFYSNYPLDKEGGKKLIKKLENLNVKIKEIDTSLKVYEIINLAQKAKITLVTRLHAGIMAFLGGSKVIAIAYQPKVEHVLQENQITSNIITLSFFNYQEIIKNSINTEKRVDLQSIQKKIDNILKEAIG